MIARCSDYLAEKIRAVMGANCAYFTRMRELKTCAESHVAAAIVDSDLLTASGRPARNVDIGVNDLKLFDRTVTINVVLGEYKWQTLEPLFEQLLASLDRGLFHEGHYIPLELGEAGWVGKEDSLIKAEVAVEIPFIFKGGIYKPKTFCTIENVTIEREDSNGE